MKRVLLLILAFSFIGFYACKNGSGEASSESNATSNTVEHKGQANVSDGVSQANALQVAKSLDDFSTLVVAIEAGGVEDAVVNAGPLTIFAPINEAFGKLPEGTVENLLKPENKKTLAFILTNHVAPANYPEKQLKKEAKKGRKLYMASGKYLEVKDTEEGLFVGGTKILKTVRVSNGWIHVIADVLVPED
jgi:uncharacterized surface protein with fasciclin (FAS1) repeats